jgi:hypothetical protein
MSGHRIPLTGDETLDAARTALDEALELAHSRALHVIQTAANLVKSRYGYPALGVKFRYDIQQQAGALMIAADDSTRPLAHADGDLSDMLEQAITTLFTCGTTPDTDWFADPYTHLRYTVHATN